MREEHDIGSNVGGWMPVGQAFIRTRNEIWEGAGVVAKSSMDGTALYQLGRWILPKDVDREALFDRCLYGIRQAIAASDAHLRKYMKTRHEAQLPLYSARINQDLGAEELFQRFCIDCGDVAGAYLAPAHMIGAAHLALARSNPRSVSLSPCTFIEHEEVFYGIAAFDRDDVLHYRLFKNTSELREEADEVQVIGFIAP